MLHLIVALLINAVPVYGVVELGWSASTVLVLFWLENLLGASVNGLRILIHARLSRRRGHYAYEPAEQARGTTKSAALPARARSKREKPKPTGFLAGFLAMTLIFTLAHGVFVGVVTAMMQVNRCATDAIWCFDAHAFELGALGLAAFLALDLLIDLPRIARQPFAWIERVSGGKLGRVLVLHLGIIFGFGAMAIYDSPVSILIVLLGLKALIDAAVAWGSTQAKPAVDAPPPKWLMKIAPVGKDGERLEDYWAQSSRREAERAARHEEIVP